ncbi:MAG: type II secretion system protein GspG [Phycisphaerales bacterium]|nr:type II secretion system protein GspG [Phycisphaerales bacterium]
MTDRPRAARNTEGNSLGVAGFVVSLVGFLSCGLLSPIGLILSLVALKKEPKGLAIAGVVLGALGLCGMPIALLFFLPLVLGLLVAAGATGLALALGGDQLMAQAEMTYLHDRIGEYQQAHGALPLLLTDLDPSPDADALTDPWGNDYVYVASPDGTYKLSSMGEDGQAGTADDVKFNPDQLIRIRQH